MGGFFQTAPAPPTLPVIRVVLPHTEACDPTLLQPHYILNLIANVEAIVILLNYSIKLLL